jgi:hypothetical protein
MGVRTAHQTEEKAQMVVKVRRLQPASTEDVGDGADSGDDAADLDAAAQGQATQLAAEMKASLWPCTVLRPHPAPG